MFSIFSIDLRRSPIIRNLCRPITGNLLCSHSCPCADVKRARVCPERRRGRCSKCTHFTAHEYYNSSLAAVAWKQQRPHLPSAVQSSLFECCLVNLEDGPGALVLPGKVLNTLALNRVDLNQLWLQPRVTSAAVQPWLNLKKECRPNQTPAQPQITLHDANAPSEAAPGSRPQSVFSLDRVTSTQA